MMNRLSDKVAYEQAIKQYEQEMELWRQQIQTLSILTADKLVAFLNFPDGIWINSENFGIDDELFGETVEMMPVAESMDDAGYGDDIDEDEHSNMMMMMMGESATIDVPRIVTTSNANTITTSIVEVLESGNNPQLTINKNGIVDPTLSSDVEILSTDLRTDNNMVFKQYRERKQKDWLLRTKQLDGIRRIYVPQFVFLLYSVHADAGNYTECLQIADIVADENRQLYTTFTHEQIVDLLNKFREISLATI